MRQDTANIEQSHAEAEKQLLNLTNECNAQKVSFVMTQVIEDKISERDLAQLSYINDVFCICDESRAEIQDFIESLQRRYYLNEPEWLQQIIAKCERLAKAVKAFKSDHYDRCVLHTKFIRVLSLWDITETYDSDPQPEMSDEVYRHSMLEEVDCLYEQLLKLCEYASDIQLVVLSEFIYDLRSRVDPFFDE